MQGKIKMIHRLGLVFGITILLLGGANLLAFKSMNTLSDLTNKLYRHPFTVSISVLRANRKIVAMHCSMIDVVSAKNNHQMLTAINRVNQLEENVYKNFTLIDERFQGDKKLVNDALKMFRNWKPIRDEVIALVNSKEKEKATAVVKEKETMHMALLNNSMKLLEDFAMSKADEYHKNADKTNTNVQRMVGGMLIFSLIIVTILAFLITQAIQRQVGGDPSEIEFLANEVARGNFDIEVTKTTRTGILKALILMAQALKSGVELKKENDWLKESTANLNICMRGIQNLPDLSREIVTFLTKCLGGNIGALYLADENKRFKLTGNYAFSRREQFSSEFKIGEGVAGQAVFEKERILLTRVPDDYIEVSSCLGGAAPKCIVVHPFVRDDEVLGVVEIGTLDTFSEKNLKFLDNVSESIAIEINTIQTHTRVGRLLEKSQAQTEALEAHQKELRQANKSLEKQTKALKKSESDLQSQKEELRQTNESLSKQSAELEEQAAQLEEQKSWLDRKNRDLETSGSYKSEFLANMSHELRTPLNSILLLSEHLANNKETNLTPNQLECAKTVHTSGNELLNLINEVLDLAKVESGKMILEIEKVALSDIAGTMKRNFKPVADHQGVIFNIKIADQLPETITTDSQRVSQIIKNLLSNAFKFTEKGSVTLKICRPEMSVSDGLNDKIAFVVEDTGIGIAIEKHETVFQAFKQADGSTSRNFGGTGLGLSISRKLAHLLGGELTLKNRDGQGSVFTLCLPETLIEKDLPDTRENHDTVTPDGGKKQGTQQAPADEIIYLNDDRKLLNRESRSILIIEDDPSVARILRDTAREKGFKTLVAESGETGLHLTDCYAPNGIILDMGLPGMDGKAVLARLKENLATRHIPVHIMSASDKTVEPLHMGAVGYLTKPVSMEAVNRAFGKIEHVLSDKIKKILVVEDNTGTQKMLRDLITDSRVEIMIASTGEQAQALIKENDFDCMILDLELPDMSGIELLTRLRNQEDFKTPVIVHTAKDLTREERTKLDKFAGKIVLKDTKAREKLLDDTCLFLHRVEADLPEEKRAMLKMIHDRQSILEGKKILIVDDDMRNVFALINILEDKGMETIVANNGKESLEKISLNPDISLVLMDIMMPEMDGYQAMIAIRGMESKIKNVPIIALTAKAMKGDRGKCIEAGASDYLSKPVDSEKLLSMLRVWLY